MLMPQYPHHARLLLLYLPLTNRLSTGSYVHHNGDWVRFEDVVQRIAELEAENKQLKEGLNYAGRRIIMVTVVIIVLLVNGHGGGW